ncbi:hypothetical protein NESM_000789900 [Novymonas esmeraldas]|uniref:Uncharacterized protein n=1 Tax=Novymonas esmeraldas TaxID=1808958 RepID=A0AAW0EZ17_9TRYP
MSAPAPIVKRRPSRPDVSSAHADESAVHHGEQSAEAAEEVYGDVHAEEDHDVAPRGTCKPSAVPANHHAEESDDEQETNAAAPVPVEEEEEEDEQARNGGAATPPADVAKTARPRSVSKAKASVKRASKTKSTVVAPKVAPAVKAAAASPPKKKKPTVKVNIANVERQPPVPEGVNTPRSIALCKKHGVPPSELAPYGKEHFKGTGVSDEVAELRYHSYEKRRRARMAQLAPAYKACAQADSADPSPAAAASQSKAQGGDGGEGAAAAPRAAAPAPEPVDEEAEMQKQFEAQHQRLLEQERRKTASGYDANGHRRSTAATRHSYGGSPRSAGSPQSPGRHSSASMSARSPLAEQPYSAAKIYSASIVENRPLTQSESVMIEEIHEREARRIDTQERAYIIQENKQLMHVERELTREVRTSSSVQKKAEDREKKQYEMYKRSQVRQQEVAERRKRLEEERQARVEDSIAEKESRIHATDPYASVASRRLSNLSTRRASAGLSPNSADAAASQ